VAFYCGLVPSERSSGGKVRRGPITRAGNPRLRRCLVEAAPPWAVQAALRAERRLAARYRTLAGRKHSNQAKTAVASELVGFLWATLLQERETRS